MVYKKKVNIRRFAFVVYGFRSGFAVSCFYLVIRHDLQHLVIEHLIIGLNSLFFLPCQSFTCPSILTPPSLYSQRLIL